MPASIVNSTASPIQFERIWDVGEITLNAGAGIINNPNITANTALFLQLKQKFLGHDPDFVSYAVFPGSRIELLSKSGTDECVYGYMLVEKLV